MSLNNLKYVFFACIILLFFSIKSNAQDRQIQGQVVSSETGEFVPFVSVSVPGQKTGTSGDDQGNFVLSLSKVRAKDFLLISSIGYQPLKVLISEIPEGEKQIFRLEPAILVLEEQVVTAESTDPVEIIRKASGKLRRNLGTKPYFISSLYSEKLTLDGNLVGGLQGYGITYTEGYNSGRYSGNSQPRDQIQWKHIRRSLYDSAQKDMTYFIAAYKLLKAKELYLHNGPVNERNISKYEYKLDSISVINDNPVYSISFTSAGSGSVHGYVMIEGETLRLLELKVANTMEKKKFDLFNKKLKSKETSFYMSFGSDGKVSYIDRMNMVIVSESPEGQLKEDLMLSSGQFNRNQAAPINQAQRKVLFYDMVNPVMNYSADYWVNYDELSLKGKSGAELNREFSLNHGRRIQQLPKGYSTYQQLYNDQQLIDIFFADF